ncbi:RBBP9/YdeN family alpha/beta hydrolase [Nocardia sp. NPDC088792]|uniref:RBBP9/YdeN family alpha/beta hydrolase n=1 Tax=Nocardia sp. NPDC088792 TaxID=3364332 RepID=UPI0038176021
MHYLIVPGIDDSDGDHWQSHWQNGWGAAASRITPASWSAPDLDDWIKAVDRAVLGSGSRQTVVVAHSLGCLAVTEWLTRQRADRPGIVGMFLVAPPDSTGPNFPTAAKGFAPTATGPLGLPGLVVSSENDPYCEPSTATALATAWGLDHLSAGRLGHINSASNLAHWRYGRDLLTAFAAGLGRA